MKDAAPSAIRLVDYRPPDYVVETADLTFDLREQGTRVISRLALRRHPQASGDTLRLDGEGLSPVWLRLDGDELPGDRYTVDDTGLTLFGAPDACILESEVVIEPQNNTALEGLYRSGGLYCTQCEPEGFRRITWFVDRPDVMARFNVRIEADAASCPVLLSNGNPRESGQLPDGRHYAIWEDPFPKPSYLFALVAGDLAHVEDRHVTPSGRDVRLRIYVEPPNIDRCGHAMQSLRRAMRWDEERYGREYDLDVFNIVAVGDFNMGAMENKGLNVFNAKYVLARADTATDRDYLGIEGVVAHEYFHNWTGNRITCRDWFQLSLKEGFTVYRDQEFSADMGARGVKRIDDVRLLRAHQFAEDAGPMAHPVRPDSYIEINNFYTVTVYEKGAEVVRMQANLLGPERFRRATDLYFERHDGQAVTTEDFVACMAEASGIDLSQMQHWYDYAGTPEVRVQGEFDAAAGVYTLHMEQSVPATPQQSEKPPFLIPILTALVGPDGSDLAVRLDGAPDASTEHMLALMDRRQSFRFDGVDAEPTPSLLRNFSAPVRLEFDYSDAQLMFLMAHDADGFNRWDAAQTLLRRSLLQMAGAYRAGVGMVVAPGLIDAFARVLSQDDVEPAVIAEVFSLPSVSYLGDFMPVVDVEALHAAREALRAEIGNALFDALLARYHALDDDAPYAPTPEAIGRRSLKNVILGLLLAGDPMAGGSLCEEQYERQHNMTDVMAALALLADSRLPARARVLDDFEQRWRRDPLVMDKWFAVQAMSSQPETLARVRALMAHPAFSIGNPNRVRALIGTFANGNPLRFHAGDGSGYRFVGEQVKALDAGNPQVAAPLVRTLSRWRRFDADRQARMRAVLEDIVASGASRDVFEVASKSLQAAGE
jgi:aminopeptidase N